MSTLEIILAISLFFVGYVLNMFYITVFYHRGLAHKSIEVSDRVRKFVFRTGMWITGMDPKSWVCMHRMHHTHSDTEHDPHTPEHCGNLFDMFKIQLQSYRKILIGLLKDNPEYTKVVKDIDYDVHWTSRVQLWYLPYVFQGLIGVALLIFFHPVVGIAYAVGIMSHPVQGALVNYFGHKTGYRNFETTDNSTNNWLVAFITMGEGYQNNHHHRPGSAKFKVKWYEVDFGYMLVRVAKFLGIIKSVRTS
ncbi:MAG: acyl-CoA desaturase [Bacteroidota bacterium]